MICATTETHKCNSSDFFSSDFHVEVNLGVGHQRGGGTRKGSSGGGGSGSKRRGGSKEGSRKHDGSFHSSSWRG